MSRRTTLAIILGILLMPCLFVPLCRAEEQITITTYYPAPNGVYRQIRAYQMSIGSAYIASPLPDGNIIVSGNVGIGTASPLSRLHVQGGDIKIRSINNPAIRFQHDDDATWASIYRLSSTGELYINNNQGNPIILANAQVLVTQGNLYTNGIVYVNRSGANPTGCLMMSYGSSTGIMTCPPTFTINTTLSGGASATGGFMFCCK